MSTNRPDEEWEAPGYEPPSAAWEVDSFLYPCGSTHDDNDKGYSKALSEGWEPFAVTSAGSYDKIWLRRKA